MDSPRSEFEVFKDAITRAKDDGCIVSEYIPASESFRRGLINSAGSMVLPINGGLCRIYGIIIRRGADYGKLDLEFID